MKGNIYDLCILLTPHGLVHLKNIQLMCNMRIGTDINGYELDFVV